MDNLAKKILERFKKAESDRQLVEPILQEISDYVLIHKGSFTKKGLTPSIDTAKVFDSTAIEAAKRLGSTIHGGLTNSASKWFSLQVLGSSNLSVPARTWLEEATAKMLSIFNGSYSGFSSHNYEAIMSQVTLGTGAMFVEYDKDCRSLKFSSVHLSKIFVLEDRWGNIDTVFVKDTITIRQAVQEFGLDVLHERWQRMYETDQDAKVDILHCVKPVDGVAGKKYSGFKFDSIYIDIENGHVIQDKGMFNMPYIIGRFDKHAGEIYGRSPAWDAMPEIRMLNQQRKDFIKAAQLMSQPPLLLSDDAVMPNLDIRPLGKIVGGIDPVTGQNRLAPLHVGGDLNGTLTSMETAKQTIKEMFFVDQLYFKEGTPVTATEASQRQEARTQMLSPAIDRIKTEYLDRLIRVCFDILFREGQFGPVPDELAKHEMEIEYLSPLSRLNKMQDVLSVQRALAPLAPFASMAPSLFANIFDSIKFQETVSYALDAAGFPALLQKTQDEIDQLNASRQQQANMQQNLQLAQFASQLNKPIQ